MDLSAPQTDRRKKAYALTEDCMPVLAEEAARLGLADHPFEEDWHGYHGQLIEYCQQLMEDGDNDKYLSMEANNRARDHAKKPIGVSRC